MREKESKIVELEQRLCEISEKHEDGILEHERMWRDKMLEMSNKNEDEMKSVRLRF